MSSNTKRVKIILLLMLCRAVIPCCQSLIIRFFGLDTIKKRYVHDVDFKDILLHCTKGKTWNKFVLNDGFVFRANKLCISDSSIRLLLLHESHGGGLMGHFGVKKT